MSKDCLFEPFPHNCERLSQHILNAGTAMEYLGIVFNLFWGFRNFLCVLSIVENVYGMWGKVCGNVEGKRIENKSREAGKSYLESLVCQPPVRREWESKFPLTLQGLSDVFVCGIEGRAMRKEKRQL